MLIRSALNAGFSNMKQQGIFVLPLDGMLAICRFSSTVQFTGTPFYCVEKGHCERAVSIGDNITNESRSVGLVIITSPNKPNK